MVKDAKDIIETLRDRLSEHKPSKIKDKDIAPYLNMTPSSLAVNKNRNTIPYNDIIKLCGDKGFDLNEVFLGDGHILSTCEEDTREIRVLENVHGSCGGGSDNDDMSSEFMKIDRKIIDAMKPVGVHTNIEAIKAVGDSMEPTVKDGAVVLIDRNNTKVGNGIFVIHTQDSGLLIKRISLKLKGTIDIISDNTLYHREEANLSDVTVVGKVLGVINAV